MEDSRPTTTQVNSGVNILAIIVFFIIFIPSSFHPVINSISLYILIPILFLYSVIKNPRLIVNYKPLTYLLLLFCWSLITMIKSKDLGISLREIRQLVGVFFLCCIFVRYCFVNPKYIYIFYILYILKFFTLFYYGYTHGLLVTDKRFSLEELNANMFGYFGFFSVVSAFFLWQSLQHNFLLKISSFVLFWLCLSLSVVTCFYAASRAGIAISVLMATSLIAIYFFYPFSKKAIIGIILLIAISVAIIPVLDFYYEGSILERRFQIESVQNESRYVLAKRAIVVGFQNPMFGVGPGNYRLYNLDTKLSHSSYTELFANNGIIALIIFLSLLYYFYKRNRYLFSSVKNCIKDAMYFLSYLILFALYNVFYPFYLQLFLMGFFYIVMVHMEIFIISKEIPENQPGETL